MSHRDGTKYGCVSCAYIFCSLTSTTPNPSKSFSQTNDSLTSQVSFTLNTKVSTQYNIITNYDFTVRLLQKKGRAQGRRTQTGPVVSERKGGGMRGGSNSCCNGGGRCCNGGGRCSASSSSTNDNDRNGVNDNDCDGVNDNDGGGGNSSSSKDSASGSANNGSGSVNDSDGVVASMTAAAADSWDSPSPYIHPCPPPSFPPTPPPF